MKKVIKDLFTSSIMVEGCFLLMIIAYCFILEIIGGETEDWSAIIWVFILAVFVGLDCFYFSNTREENKHRKAVKLIHHFITVPLAQAVIAGAIYLTWGEARSYPEMIRLQPVSSSIMIAYIVIRFARGAYRHKKWKTGYPELDEQ